MLLGCDPSGAGDTGSEVPLASYSCELGTLGTDGWVSLADAGTVELMLGFQGFVLASLAVRADGPPEGLSRAAYGLEIEGTDPVSGSQPDVGFSGGESDEVLAFFTGNYVSYYVGRSAHVALRLTSATAECVAEGDAVLVDDDPCIHTGGEPDCPEGGT